MNDEITAARRKKRRKVRTKRFFWFFVALVVLLGSFTVLNSVTKTTFADVGDFFATTFKGGGYPVKLGELAPMQVERMSMSYAVVTKAELLTYSSGGAQLMAIKHGYLNPCIAAKGNRILLYNAGSRDVSVYNRSRHIASFKTEYAIIDAAVSDDGTLAILTQSDQYNSQLEIYQNGNYDRLFRWYGDKGFPIGVYISDGGSTVSVARMIAKDGEIYTVLASIGVSEKKENYEVEFAGMTLEAYYEGDSIIAVTNRGAYLLDKNGEIKQTYAFPETPILAITRDQNSSIAVAFGDNNRFAVNKIVVLKRTLAEQCIIEMCGVVTDMYMSGNRLYVLGDRMVGEYDVGGRLLRRYETDFDTFAIFELNGLIAVMPDYVRRLTTPVKEEE